MNTQEVAALSKKIIDETEKVIVGKRHVVEMVLATILANGHILFEDYPGLAKTLMAKTLAATLGCTFRRVQFTPDLLPADITGTYVFDQKESSFKLRRGPIFTHVLLGDEINRSPPKTQSALLESMQERQVTIEGETRKLEKPFVVMGTQNPIEYEGTYPLPEAQIDRFMVRLSVGYPKKDDEKEILVRRRSRGKEDAEVSTIANPRTVTEMQESLEQIHLDSSIDEYIVEIVHRTRQNPLVELGASPRGSLALMHLARAKAALQGRDYVVPDDVRDVAVPALSHRLILKTGSWLSGEKAQDIIRNILVETSAPKAY